MRAIAPLTLIFSVLVGPVVAQTPPAPSSTGRPIEQILRHVPDDAHLLLVVPSIDELVGGIAAFGRTAASAELAEVTADDLLGQLLGPATAALNTAGPLVLVLSAERDEPLLLATVRSRESWKSTTQPAPLGDGVTLYDFGPDRCLAAAVGDVAIFARERSELRRALDATGRCAARLANELGPLCERRQALLWVDVPAWRPRIDAQTGALVRGLYVGMAAAGPDAEIGMKIWNWMIEQFKRTLGEAEVGTVGLRVGAVGVQIDSRLTFRADTSAARYLGQVRRPGRDLLRGLPGGSAPLVIAYEWEDTAGGGGLNEALAEVVAGMDAIKQKVGEEKLQTVMRMSIDVNRKVPGTSAVFSACPQGQGLLYWGLYLTSEGPAVQRELRRICELTPELVSAWGTFPTAMKQGPTESIANTDADVYQFNFGDGMSALQPVMQVVYGQDPTLFMAPHPQGVAYAFGPREHSRRKLAELLTPGTPQFAGDARVAEVLQVLAPNPQCCVLIDLPAILGAATTMLTQFGVPAPRFESAPAESALIGLTVYLEPQAIRAELYVPAAPVKAILQYAEGLQRRSDGGF